MSLDLTGAWLDRVPRAAALLGGVLGGPACVDLSLTCDEADALAAGLGLLRRWDDALSFLRPHAEQDAEDQDEADRHAAMATDPDLLRRHLAAIVTLALHGVDQETQEPL